MEIGARRGFLCLQSSFEPRAGRAAEELAEMSPTGLGDVPLEVVEGPTSTVGEEKAVAGHRGDAPLPRLSAVHPGCSPPPRRWDGGPRSGTVRPGSELPQLGQKRGDAGESAVSCATGRCNAFRTRITGSRGVRVRRRAAPGFARSSGRRWDVGRARRGASFRPEGQGGVSVWTIRVTSSRWVPLTYEASLDRQRQGRVRLHRYRPAEMVAWRRVLAVLTSSRRDSARRASRRGD